MAWTEQCKLAFYANCHGKIQMKQGRERISMNRIFKEMSEESGIPAGTLKRWWHAIKAADEQENQFKNEPPITAENNNKNETEIRNICIQCEEKPVAVHSVTGKPYGPKSKYHGLCHACAKNKQMDEKMGQQVVCPHCGKKFRFQEGVKNG